jgi:hypothetical protein
MPQNKKSIVIKKNKLVKQQTTSQQSLNQSPTPFRRTVMTHLSSSLEKKITKSAFFDGAVARKSQQTSMKQLKYQATGMTEYSPKSGPGMKSDMQSTHYSMQ